MKRNGFTLVELLIVFTIMVTLTMMMIGIFNTVGLTARGRDAQRKKDLNRMKVAFEEYFNDKGYFPDTNLLTELQDINNCKSNSIFAPYLVPWPCDPNGESYHIYVETNKFRIITNLENKKDKDIPSGWYIKNDFIFPVLNLDTNSANYGVSSSNILWYDGLVRDYSADCYISTCFDGNNGCNDYSPGGCIGSCYYQPKNGGGCVPECKVPCCGDKCNQ
jgi:type II secretory pathway pseudopilin PulG